MKSSYHVEFRDSWNFMFFEAPEFLEDYDFTLHYHPGKENVVADALSRKSQGLLASIASWEWRTLETVGQFGLQYCE